ncbi:MAG: beta-ketoacyl-[acyl-carrier-protein] synthase II [Gemmatimonadetes bacterium]|nr:MAG: beta-ketoacyl-[acyl-carrier-protein] synthase II [Gemmatimonadota bacterium]
MRERVAITGIGVVTPIGIGRSEYTEALRAGRSGSGPITAFDCEGFDTRIAAEVDDGRFDAGEYVEPRKMVKHMSRSARFAVAAAAMARRDSGLASGDVDPYRIAVSLGAGGMGPVDLDQLTAQATAAIISARGKDSDALDIPAFARVFRERTNPISMLRGLPNLAAAHVAIQQNARGPNNTITTACSAGTQAIGEGLRAIQRGDADVVFAGGADAMINPVGVLGFSMLGTLSRRNDQPARASRPFDVERDGFVIGEGAAMLVLERESSARARGARVYAELAGYGCTCDAYRITDERPDAEAAVRAMQRCLEDAGLTPDDIGYINAHGTGTQMNDATETRAIQALFGRPDRIPPMSSTKSMIGHLLAAAGAAELAATVLGLDAGFLPPTINYDSPDPACDLDCVPNTARAARPNAALSNSFGFGGQNACLAIRRW